MRFDELGLPEEFLKLLDSKGYKELYPPQAEAVKAGVLQGEDLLVTSPTASGKTLIAMMAAYLCAKKGRKAVYLSPLRALASEKYSEFKELEPLGVRSVISTGDFDASAESLGRFDVLILTNEKFDSILRQGVSWLSRVGLFVSDEVHLAGSSDRGPTLEMILTKIRHLGLNAQLLSLSATVSNSEQISKWLGSKLVKTVWRPVPLREGVYDYGRIVFADGAERQVEQSSHGAPIDVALDSVKGGGQVLLFAGTRRRAVSLAVKASSITKRLLSAAEKESCAEAGRKIRSSGEETGLSRLLAETVETGSAFHHAGLEYEHRRIVEEYFRGRSLKLLASTPTLAAGVNLPARRVVVADLARYDSEAGMNSAMSVLDYRQMAGRAGRPQYDDYGETVIVPSSSFNPSEVLEHYARGEVEPIESRLGEEWGMRVHLLATVASSAGLSRRDIDALFSMTLLASQVGSERIRFLIDRALGYLISEKLVAESGGLLHSTDFGRRVSTLYIDPVTGVLFRDSLRHVESVGDSTVGLLQLIAKSPDFEPKFPMREKYYETAYQFLEEHFAELLHRPDKRSFLEYDEILQDMRTVLVLYHWTEEWREDDLLERLGIEPGDLHRAVDSSDWLLHALAELARLYGKGQLAREIEFLRRRVYNGVKAELVELTSLQGIGRVRARALYASGYRSIKALREASVERLAQVERIGPVLARRIREETG